jgi:general stress protein 26
VNDTQAQPTTQQAEQPDRPQGREAIPEIARIVKTIDTCMFATRDGDGILQARPMSNNGEVEWDGTSWFFAPSEGRLVAEIERDPECLTTYRADDRFAWVALSGEARIVQDDDAKRRLWLTELERWFPNGPEDPGVALIRFESTAARWWTDQGEGRADLRETAPEPISA